LRNLTSKQNSEANAAFGRVRLIAVDMDGTLLNEQLAVSDENLRAIRKAQAMGIHLVIATGRGYDEAVRPLRDAGLVCPVICVNGAETRSQEGIKLCSTPLSPESFRQLDRIFRNHRVYYELYTNQGTFTDNRQKAINIIFDYVRSMDSDLEDARIYALAEERFATGERIEVHSYSEVLSRAGIEIYKLLAFSYDLGRLQQVRRQVEELGAIAVSSSADHNLEINHIQAQKGIAVEQWAKRHGIPLEQVMAIGDNRNDLSMLLMAGFSVAMGNADEDIKRSCKFVTKTNQEHGVAHAIEWVLKEWNG